MQLELDRYYRFQDEDFRPASEVFGKGGMDLDYLNQVKIVFPLCLKSGELYREPCLKKN